MADAECSSLYINGPNSLTGSGIGRRGLVEVGVALSGTCVTLGNAGIEVSFAQASLSMTLRLFPVVYKM